MQGGITNYKAALTRSTLADPGDYVFATNINSLLPSFVVFEDNDYRNTWDGSANRGLRVGDQLPDGTYYYMITIQSREYNAGKVQRFVGYVTLLR